MDWWIDGLVDCRCIFIWAVGELLSVWRGVTCSHNDPLLTDKVSKCARRRIRKGFGGRQLRQIDSVKPLSILGDRRERCEGYLTGVSRVSREQGRTPTQKKRDPGGS